MNDYYVSLVRDLLGYYLHFKADSEVAVRNYLQEEYSYNSVWKLPWCSIYTKRPPDGHIIEARCGELRLASN